MSGDASTERAAPPAILLVDDVEANLVALEAVLGSLPAELVRAQNGNDALKQLLKRDFAVALLDVQMPGMDGFEVARYARQNPATSQVPIIFITAMNETPENLQRGYGSGAFDFLFKPVNPHVLRSKAQTFLDLYLSRRRLQSEIEAHKATMAELEAFNYSVSHDLRAPLRPLDGFSQALIESYGDRLDGKGLDYLNRIRAAAQRMSHLIDDMLELSRVGRAELSREPVDLSALVEGVTGELREGDPARAVEVICPAGVAARGDARLLRIVFENLLRNAWKFTRDRPRARIEFGRAPGAEATYYVRDDGAGFDPALAGRLFQPFQRLHRQSEFEGTGIGLAIVARIVRRHGGRVWAESAPGQGATFTFTLPDERPPGGGPDAARDASRRDGQRGK